MNSRSLVISLALHILLGLVMVWVGQAREPVRRPLPEVTTVRLMRPAAVPAPIPSRPTEEIKFPEPKPQTDIPKPKVPEKVTPTRKPPLEIPVPNRPKSEPVADPAPRQSPGETATPKNVPKELIGEGVSLHLKNPGFEYDFYLGVIQSKLEQNFRPPPGKQKAMAVVSFVIQKNGEVTDIQVVRSSGNLLVDQAAQRAVRAAGRFPPLPAQFGGDHLAMNVDFVANPSTGG